MQHSCPLRLGCGLGGRCKSWPVSCHMAAGYTKWTKGLFEGTPKTLADQKNGFYTFSRLAQLQSENLMLGIIVHLWIRLRGGFRISLDRFVPHHGGYHQNEYVLVRLVSGLALRRSLFRLFHDIPRRNPSRHSRGQAPYWRRFCVVSVFPLLLLMLLPSPHSFFHSADEQYGMAIWEKRHVRYVTTMYTTKRGLSFLDTGSASNMWTIRHLKEHTNDRRLLSVCFIF